MGQSSSRQDRHETRNAANTISGNSDTDGAAATRPRRIGTLRRALAGRSFDVSRGRTEREQASLRERTSGRNRLSQLFQPNESDGEGSSRPDEQVETVANGNGTALARTGSRFREMLRERTTMQRRASYLRSAQPNHGEDELFSPPRLPSIDLSSTFDDTFGRSHAAEEPLPPPLPRSESSRRSNQMRLSARPFRNLTHSLRRRRAASPASTIRQRGNEDQAAMLSRLLSVAAAATAATLMGDDSNNNLSEARSLTGAGLGGLGGAEGEDGSFDGFLRALQNGRIASALRQGGSDSEGDTQPPSLNFFRMFRFGAGAGENTQPQDPTTSAASHESGQNEGRMVPIIIVGIRSINPNSNAASSPEGDLPPFIDALGNFPTPLPAHALGTHGHDSIDSILRPPQNGTSFRHRRRASMGGFGMGRSRLNDRMDDQRDHRSPDRRRERPWSVASSNFEPRPPPATPASPSPELSRISSRNTTPSHSRPASFVANSLRDFSNDSRRNSILHRSSAASPLSAHTEETASIRSTHSGTGLLGDSEPYRFHRRSDTAPNVHYPRFASGHPRRNGVVEPDNLPSLSRTSTSADTDASSNENRNDSRSWIIYVLGGSYPENHPILTTPSLFTENPTYEDMMLLSALLGPAKAPVATEEDVESAGGLYNIISIDEGKTMRLVARVAEESDNSEQDTVLETGQRCLVCLSDFEATEVARKLSKCQHLFHKECIDQWLTTGRNSCPLCREQGVNEKKIDDAASDNAGLADSSTAINSSEINAAA